MVAVGWSPEAVDSALRRMHDFWETIESRMETLKGLDEEGIWDFDADYTIRKSEQENLELMAEEGLLSAEQLESLRSIQITVAAKKPALDLLWNSF